MNLFVSTVNTRTTNYLPWLSAQRPPRTTTIESKSIHFHAKPGLMCCTFMIDTAQSKKWCGNGSGWLGYHLSLSPPQSTDCNMNINMGWGCGWAKQMCNLMVFFPIMSPQSCTSCYAEHINLVGRELIELMGHEATNDTWNQTNIWFCIKLTWTKYSI